MRVGQLCALLLEGRDALFHLKQLTLRPVAFQLGTTGPIAQLARSALSPLDAIAAGSDDRARRFLFGRAKPKTLVAGLYFLLG
jgi:hypothetical protein